MTSETKIKMLCSHNQNSQICSFFFTCYLALSSLSPKDSRKPGTCGMERGMQRPSYPSFSWQEAETRTTYLVYVTYYIRLSYTQKVIIAFQRSGMIFKFMPSEILFCQRVLLDHGPHAPIQNHYPLLQNRFNFILHSFLRICWKKINRIFKSLWNSLSISMANLSSSHSRIQ